MVAYSLLAGLDHTKLDLDPFHAGHQKIFHLQAERQRVVIPVCVYLTYCNTL